MTDSIYKNFEKNAYLGGGNSDYVDDLYEQYLHDPLSVDASWQTYFKSIAPTGDLSHEQIRQQFAELAKHPFQVVGSSSEVSGKQEAVDQLIQAYRRYGHFEAKINPIYPAQHDEPRLRLEHYGLSEADLGETFETRGLLETPKATLKEIIAQLQRDYCGSLGAEYGYITNQKERYWLRDYIEQNLPKMKLDNATKINVLKQLISSETLEKYLDVKYVGQKRYSIEGGDSLIPLLDELAARASEKQVKEIVIGMAHRGRLNVLLNIMGQPSRELFDEFEGKHDVSMTSGDVKYHKGYSRDVKTPNGPIHVSLMFNPSHLEFINPVVMGSIRARQERQAQGDRDYAVPVIIHGDAAFAGQGTVMETLSMSQTRAHMVGGSIHVILNNQVGFTTSNPHDARSSHYCSDLAKMIDAPVFHVNGDDPEMIIKVTQMALDYRCEFHKDAFIDLVCYRRHGHQEVDEPRATQPMMYKIISAHPTTREIYSEKLVKEGVCSAADVEKWIGEYRDGLDQGKQMVETIANGLSSQYSESWKPYLDQVWNQHAQTAVPLAKIKELGAKLDQIPANFVLQRQVGAIIKAREKMTAGELPLDWGYGEIMAYATLLDEKITVRLVGEDVRRGTFFHRQSTLFDQNTGETYVPLDHLSQDQAKLQIYDSLLSELGAMGFEYGYSSYDPKALVLWEAQFGDFANGAQVIIDQFISSAYQKWSRLSGLALLLPHGYEGMGPEHSSARLERFLQMCAQDNMQVCVPTTPAQIFHLLRRQVIRPFRAPLIVMTPKSLLRNKLAVSSLEELTAGEYKLVIPEVDTQDKNSVTRVILCSGKVYYDLLVKRREQKLDQIAIVRIEQLYPFPYADVSAILTQYTQAKEVIWCQEEPMNQGAWFNTRHRIVKCLTADQTLHFAGRKSSAAPAAGYSELHHLQQAELVDEALGLKPTSEDTD